MDKYKNLIAWQRCRELTRAIYQATQHFPVTERYGLTSQLRRAAVALLQVAEDLGYLTEEAHMRLELMRAEASRVTYGLQRSVRR